MHTPITFITGNKSKVQQMEKHLSYPLVYKDIELTEIQSLDVKEIVTAKVKEAYTHVHSPVLVEDTSLSFSAFGKLPGPYIKWFLKEIGNEGLCKLLSSFSNKSAVCEVNFALYDGTTVTLFDATMNGTIVDIPRGNGGFGWDPIFIQDGYTQTRAEMPHQDYEATNPRKVATDKLYAYLTSHFTG